LTSDNLKRLLEPKPQHLVRYPPIDDVAIDGNRCELAIKVLEHLKSKMKENKLLKYLS